MNGKKAKLIRKARREAGAQGSEKYYRGQNGQIVNIEKQDYRDVKRRVQEMKG